MKKLFSCFVLIAALALSSLVFAACNGEQSDDTSTEISASVYSAAQSELSGASSAYSVDSHASSEISADSQSEETSAEVVDTSDSQSNSSSWESKLSVDDSGGVWGPWA